MSKKKEKAKKKQKKILLIVGIVLFAICTYVWLEYSALGVDYPRIKSSKRLSYLISYILQNPAGFLHATKDSVFGYIGVTSLIGFALFFAIYSAKMKPKAEAKATAELMTPEKIEKYSEKFVNNPKYGPNVPTKPDKNDDGTGNGKKVFEKTPPEPVLAECRRQACIISESLYLSFDNDWSRKNTNALIIGTAGSGKSRYYVGPNILQANTNYIVTDPSGDLYRQYAKFLENEGYDVKKLDLNDMFDSERYNPLEYIEDEKDVFTLVNMLTENMNASAGGSKEEPIWKNSKEALLRATIFYLWEYEQDPDKKNFTNVLKLINSAKIDDEDEDDYENPFDVIFKKIRQIDPDSQAVTQYDIFQSAGTGKTRDSILITTTSQLSLFGSENIRHLTSRDEMDLKHFADKKSALFICIPTEDNTFNFLASLLYSQLFLTLYGYAEKRTKYSQRVCMEYTENGVFHEENIKIFQSEDEDGVKDAKKQAEELLAKIKAGLVIEYDDFKDLFYIKTKDGETIAWRGSENDAKHVKALMEEYADIKPGVPNKLPEHCHFILDEFANTGKIPTFCEKLSTIRKYRINCSIIVQSPDQLKNMYEKEMNVIVDNCNIKLFLGTNSYETAKWTSDMLGNKEIISRGESWNSGNNGGSESFNADKKELLSPDEVLKLDTNQCIAMVYGGNNIVEPKYEITEHPNYKKAHAVDGKYKARRQKREKSTIDKAKLFSETHLPEEEKQNSADYEEQQAPDHLMSEDSEAMLREQERMMEAERERTEIRNMIERNRAKRNMDNSSKKIWDKNGLTNDFMDESNIPEDITPEELINKLESSIAITDFGPEEFYFDESE